jgi:hypothetical protein
MSFGLSVFAAGVPEVTPGGLRPGPDSLTRRHSDSA